jgi:glycosyltransferase involved in cell wall biosynthesis
LKLLGIPPIEIIPNGARVSTTSTYSLKNHLNMPFSSRLVLLPASIRRVKDIILSISIMIPLLVKHQSHYFIIAGSIRDQVYYKETIEFLNKKLNEYDPIDFSKSSIKVEDSQKMQIPPESSSSLRDRIKILDFLLHPDYLSVLKEAELVLNTSSSEGMSGSILEAFGLKVPVLARNNEGNRSLVINGINGAIFETEKEFEEWYELLMGDEEEMKKIREEMVEKARKKYEEDFAEEKEEERITGLLKRLKEKYFHNVKIGGDEYFLLLRPNVHQLSHDNIALFAVKNLKIKN